MIDITPESLQPQQEELEQIKALRIAQAKIAKQLKPLEKKYINIIQLSGAPIELGLLKANLKELKRKCVGWRKIVERELGKGYAENVLKHTKPTRIIKLEIVNVQRRSVEIPTKLKKSDRKIRVA